MSDVYDVSGSVRSSLQALPDRYLANPGSTVAVAVGSRKIDGLDKVVYECLRFLEHRGLKPFIVPAMGSHGGATAEGQEHVLAAYGITENAMGVQIVADMDVRCIATHDLGFNIYMSAAALAADHIILINRIKPHTKFKADIESGLCKMMTVGLGK
ncbi:MAG: lactate racemase domain-containing protein, partial [Desulfosalsimonadaceae bacterium]|nr:lactate racemase domain-containing protein [Desulfosalsimonadaceae bacterium]